MKIIKGILIGLLGLVVILFFAGNVMAKLAIENGVKLITGLPLTIGDLDLGLFKSAIQVKNLKLMNPPGFQDPVMVDLAELYVKYDLPSILSGKIHLPELRVDLNEFYVVKNEKGKLNIDSLTALQKAKKETPAASRPEAETGTPVPPEKKTQAKAPEIQIDQLFLKVGNAYYREYKTSGQPFVQTFPIHLEEKYSNITDPNQLVQLIVLKVMMNTGIGALTNFDIADLRGSLGGVMSTSSQFATQAEAFLKEEGVQRLAQKFKLSISKEN